MAHRLARAGIALAATVILMLPTPALADSSHDHASPSADPHAEHDMGHAPEPSEDTHDDHGAATQEDTHDHGSTPEDDGAGHTDHGTQPDSVSPEVRNLVLSGFAGVNAAVVFGAWMVRRTGPDPDPRKRTPKASR